MPETALVFGATGLIGRAVCERLRRDCSVVGVTRSVAPGEGLLSLHGEWEAAIAEGSVSRVVWAQGANAQGGIHDDVDQDLSALFAANVSTIVESLAKLLAGRLLRADASLVIVSSVWQLLSRQEKLAYSVSKSAVAGLVRSLAADLGPQGVRVNAVLPGPVDGPMTRTALTPAQLARWVEDTPLRGLVSVEQVAEAVAWLSSPASSGVTAQFLTVDGGWSQVRYV